jgi:hypothetical protein
MRNDVDCLHVEIELVVGFENIRYIDVDIDIYFDIGKDIDIDIDIDMD